jgi:hypothetical protein
MSGGLLQPTDAPGHRPTDRPFHAYGAGSGGQQVAGTTTSADVSDMNGIDRLLAGTNWEREDVNLALQAVSTLILLYWVMEVR